MDLGLVRIKEETDKEKIEKGKLSLFFSNLRLFTIIFLLLSISKYFLSYNKLFLYLSMVICLVFIFLVWKHKKIKEELSRLDFYTQLLERYEARTTNKWKEEEKEIYKNPNTLALDLDSINGNSLLKYMDFTQSLGGRLSLIDSLSLREPRLTKEEVIKNQRAIVELKEETKFIFEFQYKLSKIKNIGKTNYKDFFHFFEKEKTMDKASAYLFIFLTGLSIAAFLLWKLEVLLFPFFLASFLLNLFYSYFFMAKFKEDFADIDTSLRKFANLKEVYEFIDKKDFAEEKNREEKEKISQGKVILQKISKISDLNSLRLNFLSYVFLNGFSALNLIILYQYKKLLREENESFKESILALERLEKFISLATIGIVKKNTCMPTIVDDFSLKMTAVQHPLLREEDCKANTFQCEKDIIIITGSNMSGKTSFMKTIAMNLILAYNGSYVNAEEFQCPIAKIFTSINVKDDISKGVSTFYGELKRIKDILDYSQSSKEKMIVFIDEIFKGTNYNDRILGAKETLKKLSQLNSIVFLTTHDFELCQLENTFIKNYHFSEEYEGDKISFDYQIKEGQCKTTNAKYLMRKLGILDSKEGGKI